MTEELVWDSLRAHISPSEVDHYARCVGVARINRNEDAFRELQTLKQMQNAIQADLSEEIERKNPLFLSTPQRNTAIDRAIRFLDSLREKGHLVEPSNESDSQVMTFLKFAKMNRPNSSDLPNINDSNNALKQNLAQTRSLSNSDMSQSIEDIQHLLDDEFQRIQVELVDLRCKLFASCDDLNEVKAIQPPTTDSIQSFANKLKSKEVTLMNIAKTGKTSSSVNRLRESVRLNRIWE